MADDTKPNGGDSKPTEKQDLAALTDALGSALAGKQVDRLVSGASAADPREARLVLSDIVAEALAQREETALAAPVASLVEILESQQTELNSVKESVAALERGLEALEERSGARHGDLVNRVDQIKQALGALSTRLGEDLAADLRSIEDKVARLEIVETDWMPAEERRAAFASYLAVPIALVIGLIGGIVLADAFPEALASLVSGLRGTVGALFGAN